MDNKMLNICYATEAICGRLNGSAAEVESNKDNFKNTTFTKKIGGRGMASAVCQKFNMKEYMEVNLGCEKNIKTKNGKQVKLAPDPHKYIFDDIFGFMMADKVSIDEETYNELSEEEKALYKKSKKSYECNITKKRVSRLQMSPLVNVSNRKVETEFNICATSGDNMPYKLETYSGIMTGIANFNLNKVGKFVISDITSEFRDYSELEGKNLKIEDLPKEERVIRIEKTLNSLEYLSIKGNQTNHLTDTKPKLVILGEYSWGNNVFQGIIKKYGIDFEMLKEALEQNEEYRLSKVFIGINKFFDETFNTMEDSLNELKEDFDFIEVDNVHNTFNNYIKYMKETLE